MDRVVTVQDHGNTSAASIPLALSVGKARGQIKPGRSSGRRGDRRRAGLGVGRAALVSSDAESLPAQALAIDSIFRMSLSSAKTGGQTMSDKT